MTKANQVAPLLATLRGLIPDATEAIDEFAKLAKYVDEVEARAEQAEHSLAASERALAALRYQAQAGGCELSTVGENSYHCRADALCGLCRLRHRAEQAERDLSELHTRITDLVATWGPPTHDPDACPSVAAGVGPCFRCAVSAAVARLVGARVARESAIEDAEALRARLAESTEWGSRACEVLGYVLGTLNLCDEQHWAFDPLNVEPVKDKAVAVRLLVRDLRAKLAKTARERDDAMTLAEERRDYARAQNAKLSVECDDLRAQLTAVERERDEARAELERRKEELRLAQCPNPRDPKNGGHCDTCSGLSVARTRQLHEQEQRIAELKALNRDNLAMWEVERDALKAKLAEAERMRDTLGRRIDEVQAALNECGAGFTGQKESTRIRALRARLAKTERVVEAAREDAQHCPHACSPPCPFDRAVARTRAALRALDSPVGAGTDSGGASGAAVGNAAPPVPNMPAQAGEQPGGGDTTLGDTHPPEPAGSSCRCGAGCKPVPRYAGDDDSPVGVAATACDHKRQRCENDHAVCRDCGAVNRAVTGVVDWGPPETAREDGSTGAVADDQPASARLEKRADGWHYHDAEYPDEGYVGPFSLAIAAIAHAEGGGYLVDGADEHAPVTRAELDELRWRVERLENLTGSGSGSGSGSG